MKFATCFFAGCVSFYCGMSSSVFGQQGIPSNIEFPTHAEPQQAVPPVHMNHSCLTTDAVGMAWNEKLLNWTSLCELRVAALAMQRTSNGSSSIIRDDLGNDVINSSQFNFDYTPGIDVGLLCPLTKNWELSLRYFGLDAAEASASGNVANGVIATSPLTAFTGGPLSFSYRSRLQSGEVNVGTRIDEGSSFFAGFRMVEVREQLRGSVQSPAPFAYNVDANNNLYGFQAGGETTIWLVNERLRMDCFGKFGVLANFAEQNSSIMDPPGAALLRPLPRAIASHRCWPRPAWWQSAS